MPDAATPPQTAADPGLRRRVMVVDDDPIMCEVTSAQLAGLGWDCISAENGEQGWDLLNQQAFDLAVIDISMPKLDGFSLLRHLRQHPRTVDLPVIVCTSHNDQDSIDKAYRLGASSFVTKPINWPQFLHHVQFVMRSGDTERALRAAQAEALSASRMKNSLFQVLSHELKTPLTALIGLTDVLQAGMADKVSHEQGEQLDMVVSGARRLNGIVSDILLLSRALGAPERQGFVLTPASEIMDDAVTGQKAAAKAKGLTLRVRPVDVPFNVSCDPLLIHQALARLVSNAIKFSPQGGTVEVWAHRQPDGSAMLAVKDQGPGLPQAKLQECLRPFIQEDMSYSRPAEGLGLGLPIAKAICEAHDGELAIRSSPGQGLLAAIVLPAKAVSTPQAAA